MSVDGLNFDARPDPNNARFNAGVAREIYMEAITIDLKNIDFPANSEVMLRSRDGIPKFYGGNYDLTTHAPGAVNFYSNSNTYGETILHLLLLLDPQMQIHRRVYFKVMTRLAITLPPLQAPV